MAKNLADRIDTFLRGRDDGSATVAEIEKLFGCGAVARARRQRDRETYRDICRGRNHEASFRVIAEPNGFRGANGKVAEWRSEMGFGAAREIGEETPSDRVSLHAGNVG